MSREQLDEKAAEVKKAVIFPYTYRTMPQAEMLNHPDLAILSMIDMLSAIWTASERSNSGSNICRSDFGQIYDDFVKVVSISAHIPSLQIVRRALKVDEALVHIVSKNVVDEGLSERESLREISWRIDRLACGLCSLVVRTH